MRFFSQVLLIVRIEAGFFVRFPKLLHATLVVALIPAIYTLIYLSSVWDPASHTQATGRGHGQPGSGHRIQGSDL